MNPPAPTPSTATSATTPATPPATAALAGLALCAALPALATSITNVALPTLAAAFHSPFGQVQWVVLAYLLSSTLSVVATGRLADRLGRRPVLLAGIGVFVAGSAACALAPSLAALIAARAVQGLGAAAMMALAIAAVGDAVPKTHTGRAMGLLGAVSAAGTALGPGLGAALLTLGPWPLVFWLPLPAALIAYGLVRKALPAVPRGMATAGEPGVPAWRSPALRAGLAMNALVAAVMMASLVVGPFYLSQGLGLATAQVGLVMTVAPAVAAFAGVPAGRWVDRIGAATATAAGLAAMALACVGLVAAPAALGVAGYALSIALLAAGYALFQAANQAAVMAGVAPGRRGALSGWMTVARHAGFVGGAWGLGALYGAGAQGSGAAAAGAGLRLAFAAATVTTLLALGIALRRGQAARAGGSLPEVVSPGRLG